MTAQGHRMEAAARPEGEPAASAPMLSIISVAYKDAWALTKTARSVFRQSFDDFEYIVVDGGSEDGSAELIDFWKSSGLISKGVSEPDEGVYNAMNKGVRMARGKFVCFLNAGDVFAEDDTLATVAATLKGRGVDGVLGWGELNGRIWASWLESPAFKLSSLGFCHQALFVRRDLLLAHPFDDRRAKTDSDTKQLGQLYEAGARIEIVPEVWAVRGGEPGISADLEKTAASIIETLVTEYPELDDSAAQAILAFRRRGEAAADVLATLCAASAPLRTHLAAMILDTLFQPPSLEFAQDLVDRLWDAAMTAVAETEGAETSREFAAHLLFAQRRRASLMDRARERKGKLSEEIRVFRDQEDRRLDQLSAAGSAESAQTFVVALTSFPARLQTLPFVVRSLLKQTQAPEEIHLLLGRDEVPNRNWLSKDLLDLESSGLRVTFVDRTCHQYDKYLHVADLAWDRPLVIVDDDVIYPPWALEKLLEGHYEHPEAIIGNRCHRMQIDQAGELAPYKSWQREQRAEKPVHWLMATGAGGVLYPPGFMAEPAVTDVPLILAHAPYADDLWLKFNALAQGRRTFATVLSQGADWYHRYTPTMAEGTLMAANVDRGLNDLQVRRCTQWLDQVHPAWRRDFSEDRAARVQEGVK